jgi:cobalt/nickel transport system ATP-binding protein
MSELAVEMNDVTYVYPDGHLALQDANLKISRGEKLAILGPNGAGKSTLLMILNGLFRPSKGKVSVLGIPTNDENLGTVRRNVGLVFQDPDDQLFSPTLWEDVCFGPFNMGLCKEEVRERAIHALKAVGLEGYEGKPPHHLSAGEKKRAAIATVLAMRPKILLLDEPTANLDPKNRFELTNLLSNLRNNYNDTTLVTATHDVNFIPEFAERVYVLNKGHVIAEGSLRQIFSNSRLMSEANLEPPIITRLFNTLSEERDFQIKSLPLTVEEALHELDRYCRSRGNRNV